MYDNLKKKKNEEEKSDWRIVSIEMPLNQRDGVESHENGPFMYIRFGCCLNVFECVRMCVHYYSC